MKPICRRLGLVKELDRMADRTHSPKLMRELKRLASLAEPPESLMGVVVHHPV